MQSIQKNIISTYGGAIMLFSKNILKNRLIEYGTKENKIGQLFEDDGDFADYIRSTGAFLPVVIDSFSEYSFDFFSNETTLFTADKWETVKESRCFNLEVTDNELWFAANVLFYKLDSSVFETDIDAIGGDILSGPNRIEMFEGDTQKIEITSGKYKVWVQGFKRIQNSNSVPNFGFGFKFVPIQHLLPLRKVSKDNVFDLEC